MLLTLAVCSVMLLSATACDTRREVDLEWPTPAVPVADGYDPIIRSAGQAGIEQDPNPADLQRYFRARDQFLNAWRRENWELAKQSPAEYEHVMASIEAEWDALYAKYWQRQQEPDLASPPSVVPPTAPAP